MKMITIQEQQQWEQIVVKLQDNTGLSIQMV